MTICTRLDGLTLVAQRLALEEEELDERRDQSDGTSNVQHDPEGEIASALCQKADSGESERRVTLQRSGIATVCNSLLSLSETHRSFPGLAVPLFALATGSDAGQLGPQKHAEICA